MKERVFDRNKVIRYLVESITRAFEANTDVDVTLNGIGMDENMTVVLRLDLNGTFLPLPLLTAISFHIGDANLWVSSCGNDGLEITATYKNPDCKTEE